MNSLQCDTCLRNMPYRKTGEVTGVYTCRNCKMKVEVRWGNVFSGTRTEYVYIRNLIEESLVRSGWNPWYAWRPVYLNQEQRWAWFEAVCRHRKVYGYMESTARVGRHYWLYMSKKRAEKIGTTEKGE